MTGTAERWLMATGVGLAMALSWVVGGTTSSPAASLRAGACTAAPGMISPDSTESLAMRPLAREPMEATGRAPGARGTLQLSYSSSPYGLAVTEDGTPIFRVALETRGLRLQAERTAVAWAATPELDQVRRLGEMGPDGRLSGRVSWSRFLVFVTAEPSASSPRDGRQWSGPVLLVGRAPSSRMHTMRGHGIFEAHGIGC